jgi:glyoxylase-like metal-dependent hydrolase (beta-lactamase superfamily II)
MSLLVENIRQKILCLPDDTLVLPGHGPVSTVAREKQFNPFL